MISTGVASGAVCLGCRLRLLRQAARPYYCPSRSKASALVRRRQPPRRWFVSEGAARTGEQEHETSERKDEKTEDLAIEEKQRLERQESHHEDGPLFSIEELQDGEKLDETSHGQAGRSQVEQARRVHWKHFDLYKVHRSRNRILREETASLDVDMLGKPAHTIIMKDGGVLEKRKRPVMPNNDNKDKQREPIDYQSLLDSAEEKAPSTVEVRASIDGLRPDSDTLLPDKEFERLQVVLEEGFLKSQLSDYLEHYTQDQPDTTTPKFEWIKNVSPWVPLASWHEASRETVPQLRGYTSPNSSVKQRLAIRVMRECWGLEKEALTSGLGETEIQVRSHEFVILMRGTRRFLDLVSNMYLEADERLEAIPSRSTLRIVATKAKTATIIDNLHDVLRYITTEDFPTYLVTPSPSLLSDSLLDEVGKITTSYVRLSPNKRQVRVTWLDVTQRDGVQSGTENLRHVVLRLLLAALKPESGIKKLYAPDESSTQTEGRLLEDQYSTEKWTWKDKLGRWARYTVPSASLRGGKLEVGAASPVDQSNQIDSPFRRLLMPIERPEPPSEPASTILATPNEEGIFINTEEQAEATGLQNGTPTPFPAQSLRWSPSPRILTTATFGHILHPYRPPSPSPSLQSLLKSADQHIFSPLTPHPMLLASLEIQSSSSIPFPITSTILLRFRPCTLTSSKKASSPNGPPLELRLSLSNDGSTLLGVHSLRAVVDKHTHDVPLPSSPVDLRFQQTRYHALQGRAEDVNEWQPISNLLSRARLGFKKGELKMPAQQEFPIPTDLFSTQASIPSGKSAAKEIDNSDASKDSSELEARDHDDLQSTNYEFVGLELHRAVSLPYENFTLTYTSIEAGQGGGRRAELTLEPTNAAVGDERIATTSPGAFVEEGSEALHDDYLRACYKFAQTASLWAGHVVKHEGGKKA